MNKKNTLANSGMGTFAQVLGKNKLPPQIGQNKKIKATPKNKNINLQSTQIIEVDREALKKKQIYINQSSNETAAIDNAYKELRTNILAKLDHINAQTLMVTSPVKGNGKSTIALNLAINIAKLGQRTALLVDLDLRQPSIHQTLGYTPEFSVVDVAAGKTTIEKALVSPGVDRLSILCGNRKYNNSSEIIASGYMQTLIKEIRDRYPERIVIFDTPPLLGCDDSAVLAPKMDACLLVVEEGKTTYSELDSAIEKLGDIYLAGYVLNKSKDNSFERYYY